MVEAQDRVLQRDVDAGGTSEGLGNLEWLRQETLDLTGAGDDETLLLGQLTHTQNGDDILEGLVILEDLLDGGGGIVVNITDNVWVHDTGGRLKWIDSRVETQLGNRTGQDSGDTLLHLTHVSGQGWLVTDGRW